ncbi:MAG: response regulator [Sphingobacterium sp.]
MMKKILIADDHIIVRLGVSTAIKDTFKAIEIIHAQTYDEVFTQMESEKFDLLLLDINMPGGNNIKVIKEILSIQPDVKILVFSSYDESLYALRYMEAGASGYVNKTADMGEFINAIQSVFDRGRYMSDVVQDLYVRKLTTSKSKVNSLNPLYKLSNREMDVARHLIEGIGIIDVSNKLNLSSSTVSTYKSRIFDKLGVTNIPDLIALFKMHAEKE